MASRPSSSCSSTRPHPFLSRRERRRKIPDQVDSLAPYLPGLLRFRGQPINTRDWFPFNPLYSTRVPEFLTLRAGRGVGKSVAMMARQLIRLARFPYHQVLVVCPLVSQSDRLSIEYFQPMLAESPLGALLQHGGRSGSVRRRVFANGAIVNFLYAFVRVDQCRGYHIHDLIIDESQDIDPEFIPVLNECASLPNRTILCGGTSKTRDTSLEKSYQDSSASVWRIPCAACGHIATATLPPDGDVDQMIGPWRDDISEERPATVCPRCRRPIHPRHGWWEHRKPENAGRSLGLHIPQVIMPMHYANPQRWRDLLAKRDGSQNYTTGKFVNEVLGEPWDVAHRLIGIDDIKAAATLGPNTLEAARHRVSRAGYRLIVLGVDWGGGGVSGVSRTALAACGLAPDGTAEVLYGQKIPPEFDALREARTILQVAQALQVGVIAHDYNGVGSAREDLLRQFGWSLNQLMPIVYWDSPGNLIIDHVPPSGSRSRGYYHLQKARAFQFLAQAIRRQRVRFFNYDRVSDDHPGLLWDLYQLVEDAVEGPIRTHYRVRRASDSVSDDFAQAVNLGCWGLWHATGTRPKLD